MRFITEYKYDEKDFENGVNVTLVRFPKMRQMQCEGRLAAEISNAFDWQNPVDSDDLHYKLDIKAFPMDKWLEFKEQLFSALPSDQLTIKIVTRALEQLESFGKPSGDTITNKQLNNGTK